MRLAALLALLATPALADSEAAWDEFRAEVEAACRAAVEGLGQAGGAVAVEVNPFGSEHYGVALVTLASAAGTDRLACVLDKATGAAEITAPFLPPAPPLAE